MIKLDQLDPKLRKRIEDQITNENRTHRKIPDAVPQRDQAPALDRPVQGKEKGVQRIVVSFTGFRVKPLDPDNFAGSIKDLLDGLRHSGLLPGDEPWRIHLETEQQKVGHFKDEKTVIEITYP